MKPSAKSSHRKRRDTSPAPNRAPAPPGSTSAAIDPLLSGLAIAGLLLYSLILPGYAQAEPCRDAIVPLETQRDAVAEKDGLWTLFERSAALRDDSSLAMQADSSINKLIENLIYLCETQKGVPLTELADFVQRKVAVQGPERFKQEMVTLGKPPNEIDVWIDYARFAVRNQTRTLKPETIRASIAEGKKLMDAYVRIAGQVENASDPAALRADFLRFKQNLERFFDSDPYVSKAVRENARVPYWDVDENHGGS